mmetsp:Transcript_34507/g.55112  ORF Transcript_34507/g.55112 Transcript_34507/m.55112 type:complete len:97 (+) Transcript_34507:301-591(+)
MRAAKEITPSGSRDDKKLLVQRYEAMVLSHVRHQIRSVIKQVIICMARRLFRRKISATPSDSIFVNDTVWQKTRIDSLHLRKYHASARTSSACNAS